MDYKYIEQLLERYWQCETTLEEERILRTFFHQENVPAPLLPYKDLFTYMHLSQTEEVLDEAFDDRLLREIGETEPVKARTITLSQRLRPLFKAAAIVAIVLTLGNAMQIPFNKPEAGKGVEESVQPAENLPVAMGDSLKGDTLKTVQTLPVSVK